MTLAYDFERRGARTPLEQLTVENERLREEIAELRGRLQRSKDLDFTVKVRRRWRLTKREADFLEQLYLSRASAVTTDAIMCGLYSSNPDEEPMSNIVSVYIWKLRKKLGRAAIETERYAGYRLSDDFMSEVAKTLSEPVPPEREKGNCRERVYLEALDVIWRHGAPITRRELCIGLGSPVPDDRGGIASLLRLGMVEHCGYAPPVWRRPARLYRLTDLGERRAKARAS